MPRTTTGVPSIMTVMMVMQLYPTIEIDRAVSFSSESKAATRARKRFFKTSQCTFSDRTVSGISYIGKLQAIG